MASVWSQIRALSWQGHKKAAHICGDGESEVTIESGIVDYHEELQEKEGQDRAELGLARLDAARYGGRFRQSETAP
jgi:hypothetical protein